MKPLKSALLTGAAVLGLAAASHADDDRQPNNAQHVLLLSVDGMHEVDLRLWIANHPTGAMAKLAARGTIYNNAYTTAPSDSFPGMIAQVTGGTPKSAGVYYDDSYERTFFAPNSGCVGTAGAETTYAENIDVDQSRYDAGGTLGQPLTQIDPKKLPTHLVNGVCTPVYPHEFIRVNTLFEVLKAHGAARTAWSDKHPAYEILSGPSGKGIDDLYTPEINSQLPGAPAGQDNTTSYTGIRNYDGTKVTAVLNEIDGKSSTGAAGVGVPAIFGMNFQSVSVGQKLAKSGYGDAAGLTGGYLDANGTPGNALTLQLQFIDDSVGKFVAELSNQRLYHNTVIIISAKHGQSPIDVKLRKALPDAYSTILAKDAYGFDIADDASLVWLDPAKRTPANYKQAYLDMLANKASLGIDYIVTREELAEIYHDPFTDSRTPDFFVVTNKGVIYTGGTKLAEHGGVANDDRHVAMLVSAAGLNGRHVNQPVFTTQIAPTILSAFHISPTELQAVRQEHTQVLPGLSGQDEGDR